MDPENWLPLPNFLEVNENKIREGGPNVALDLRVAIYREMPFFKEVCDLLEKEAAPPVAANETVISTEADEQPMEISVVPTVHELGAISGIGSRNEQIPGTSKRLPEPSNTPSPTRKKANLKTDSPVARLLSKNTLNKLAKTARSKLFRTFPGNPDMPDTSAITDDALESIIQLEKAFQAVTTHAQRFVRTISFPLDLTNKLITTHK